MSAAKFHCIKSASGKVVAQSIAFRVVSIYWQRVAPFPWYLNILRLIARLPWRHCVTCLRSAHWLVTEIGGALSCQRMLAFLCSIDYW